MVEIEQNIVSRVLDRLALAGVAVAGLLLAASVLAAAPAFPVALPLLKICVAVFLGARLYDISSVIAQAPSRGIEARRAVPAAKPAEAPARVSIEIDIDFNDDGTLRSSRTVEDAPAEAAVLEAADHVAGDDERHAA